MLIVIGTADHALVPAPHTALIYMLKQLLAAKGVSKKFVLVFAITNPVATAAGAGEPHANAKTCQELASEESGFAGCTQLNVAELYVNAEDVKVVGALHDGGGAHVTFATQPGAVTVPSDVNTNVKLPDGDDAVKDGGKVVPDKVANKVAAALLPSYTLKMSKPACVLNDVKVTVTASPAFDGEIIVVRLELLL